MVKCGFTRQRETHFATFVPSFPPSRSLSLSLFREQLLETFHVTVLHGIDVVAIERDERVMVVHVKSSG